MLLSDLAPTHKIGGKQRKIQLYSAYAYTGKGVNQQVHNTYECIYMLSNSNSETIGRDFFHFRQAEN